MQAIKVRELTADTAVPNSQSEKLFFDGLPRQLVYELAITFNPGEVRQYGFMLSEPIPVLDRLKAFITDSCACEQPVPVLRFFVNAREEETRCLLCC